MKSNFTSFTQRKLLAVASTLALLTSFSHAEQKSYDTLSICSLSQNILKNQILMGMDVTYSNPEEKIENANERIHTQFTTLQKEKLDKKHHKRANLLDKSWVKIEKEMKKKQTKESALPLYTEVNAFSQSCFTLAKELPLEKSDKNKFEIATLNLHVQTLTALYAVRSWDAIDEKVYTQKVTALLASYNEIYTNLTKTIGAADKDVLEQINKEFLAFKFMTTSHSGRFMPVLAAKKALEIDGITTNFLGGK